MTANAESAGLTCLAVISVGFLLFLPAVVLQPEHPLRHMVLVYKMRDQDRLQEAQQHQTKNHNAVGCCEEETDSG